MKRTILSAFILLAVLSCNNEGGEDTGTGNRTYDLNTPTEATDDYDGTPHNVGDTTPTTNNNIYNVDSPASKSNIMDTGSSVGSKDVTPNKAH